MSEALRIREAAGAADMATARALFLDYARSLDFSLCFQDFDRELATLPGAYAAPRGAIVFAESGAGALGVVAMRPQAPGICEMKRLYVRPEARGRGLGRRLALAALAAGEAAGYRAMRLDTHGSMLAAIALYRDLGFAPVPAYYDNPLSGVLYFERALGAPREDAQRAQEAGGSRGAPPAHS